MKNINWILFGFIGISLLVLAWRFWKKKSVNKSGAAALPAKEPGRKKLRVIAIDDDPRILELYKDFFESRYGSNVTTTADPETALRLATEACPDLFITDLVHPGMDGMGLVRELRQRFSKSDLAIWVISSNADRPEVAEPTTVFGADIVTRKPVEISWLVRSTEELLAQKR